jgi:hypothetical protein
MIIDFRALIGDGKTALSLAESGDHSEIVSLLKQNGAAS